MKSRLSLGRSGALCVDLQEEDRRDARFLAEGFDSVIAHAVALQAAVPLS